MLRVHRGPATVTRRPAVDHFFGEPAALVPGAVAADLGTPMNTVHIASPIPAYPE
jgi:hypothetical protein